MPFASIPEAIEEMKAGRMIVLVDDEGRENEGDLVIAGEKCTPAAVNFMIKFGRGGPSSRRRANGSSNSGSR